VLRLDNAWNAAYRNYDRAPLENILADDFTALTPSGEQITKASFMVNPSETARSATFSEQAVHVFGKTAITRGRLELDLLPLRQKILNELDDLYPSLSRRPIGGLLGGRGHGSYRGVVMIMATITGDGRITHFSTGHRNLLQLKGLGVCCGASRLLSIEVSEMQEALSACVDPQSVSCRKVPSTKVTSCRKVPTIVTLS
jgi:hypothetical protein